MRCAILFIFGAVAILPASAQDRKIAQDKSMLFGTWKVAAEERDGRRLRAKEIGVRMVLISPTTLVFQDGEGQTDMAARYDLDSSTKPWQIALTFTKGEHKGKKTKGIVQFEFEAATLRVCYGKPGEDAPEDFTSKQNQSYFTLQPAGK